MTIRVLGVLAAVVMLWAAPSEAHAESKGKGSQKAVTKVTRPAPAPPPVTAAVPAATAAPRPAEPTAVPRAVSSAVPSAVEGDVVVAAGSAGTITTEEARALAAPDAAGSDAVAVAPVPTVDPLSLIRPARAAVTSEERLPARAAAGSAASGSQVASLFPIGAAPLGALLVASQVGLGLVIVALRRVARAAALTGDAQVGA